MKNLFKTVLVILIGLSSCQQEGVNTTIDPKLADVPNPLREAGMSTDPKFYQLVKHGDNKLVYGPNGKLQKVTFGVTKRGGFNAYVVYKYGFQTISSTFYYDNKVVQTSTYSLDDKGRCMDSQQFDRIPYGPNAYVEKESSFSYTYDTKGHLATRTNKKVLSEKTVFNWNAAGDLTKITGHNFRNGQAYESFKETFTLYYDQPAGDPILSDLRPINPEAVNLPDPYLMIFGKQSTHLVKLINGQLSQSGKYFNYTTNTDGYVTKREIYQLAGAALIETTGYEYLVTGLSISL